MTGVQLLPPIVLASKSPRRGLLLEEAGIQHRVVVPQVDDSQLQRGAVSPAMWVLSLAYLKARSVVDAIAREDVTPQTGTVLAADTVCVHEGHVLGQPRDARDARSMLERLNRAEHTTITGVCLLRLDHTQPDFGRVLFFDTALVRVGRLECSMLDRYIASGAWRGRAGGYNLAERLADGWPIECEGDPTTVMGLPMRCLVGARR